MVDVGGGDPNSDDDDVVDWPMSNDDDADLLGLSHDETVPIDFPGSMNDDYWVVGHDNDRCWLPEHY